MSTLDRVRVAEKLAGGGTLTVYVRAPPPSVRPAADGTRHAHLDEERQWQVQCRPAGRNRHSRAHACMRVTYGVTETSIAMTTKARQPSRESSDMYWPVLEVSRTQSTRNRTVRSTKHQYMLLVALGDSFILYLW